MWKMCIRVEPEPPPDRSIKTQASLNGDNLRTSIAMPRDLHGRLRREVLRRSDVGERIDMGQVLREALVRHLCSNQVVFDFDADPS